MTFDANKFIKSNLINGLLKGAFVSEQVSIFAFNYLQKGTIMQETFNEIQQAVIEYEEEQARLEEEMEREEQLVEEQP